MTATYWRSLFQPQERREKLQIARTMLLHQINTAKRDGYAGEVERVSRIFERIE
jgi:hypothetical protein